MKKFFYSLLVFVMTMSILTGCGRIPSEPKTNDTKQLKIVTTTFPIYDWVINLLGDKADNAQITMLLDSGVDLHNYQPTADDILKIAQCDLFIYIGGESDDWVDSALSASKNENVIVLNLIDILGNLAKEEEVIEGMAVEPEDEDEDDTELDEHIWLSLRNAAVLCEAISDALCQADEANADTYKQNFHNYQEALMELDNEYASIVESASVKTVLFGDRFPFRYLVDDYGLDYYAAFAGCSAETEASFETITFLANKIDELNLHYVFTIEGTNHHIAETIIQNTTTKDQQILVLNSMQSSTTSDFLAGTSYVGIMTKNLKILSEALEVTV